MHIKQCRNGGGNTLQDLSRNSAKSCSIYAYKGLVIVCVCLTLCVCEHGGRSCITVRRAFRKALATQESRGSSCCKFTASQWRRVNEASDCWTLMMRNTPQVVVTHTHMQDAGGRSANSERVGRVCKVELNLLPELVGKV